MSLAFLGRSIASCIYSSDNDLANDNRVLVIAANDLNCPAFNSIAQLSKRPLLASETRRDEDIRRLIQPRVSALIRSAGKRSFDSFLPSLRPFRILITDRSGHVDSTYNSWATVKILDFPSRRLSHLRRKPVINYNYD